MRRILSYLGYRIEYVSEYGVHAYRYDSVDAALVRPIHKDMSVAPPWAKMRIRRKGGEGKA